MACYKMVHCHQSDLFIFAGGIETMASKIDQCSSKNLRRRWKEIKNRRYESSDVEASIASVLSKQ
jgi:hypothetical protein